MTDKEKAISNNWPEWFVITGPQGSIIFRMQIDEKLLEQSHNSLKLHRRPLIRHFLPKGLTGTIGYAQTQIELKSIKKGTLSLFTLEWVLPPKFYKPVAMTSRCSRIFSTSRMRRLSSG